MNTKKPSVLRQETKGTKFQKTPLVDSSSDLFKHPNPTSPQPALPERRKGPTTRITVKYDVGFSNALYLRGKGANLSWEKGVMLKNIKPDEWVWETDAPFTTCEFKVLINDREYELGDNHALSCGASILYTPKFP